MSSSSGPYSIPEIAEKINRHRQYVWTLVKSGKIKSEQFKRGKYIQYAITEAQLAEFLENWDTTRGRPIRKKSQTSPYLYAVDDDLDSIETYLETENPVKQGHVEE